VAGSHKDLIQDSQSWSRERKLERRAEGGDDSLGICSVGFTEEDNARIVNQMLHMI
jgi:hypothetical protein